MNNHLFTPILMGDLTLKNKMVMAPLTRNRANENNAPHQLNVKYYQQRSSAGLIITEASQVSAEGIGYPATPGIYSDEQVAGWQKITDAVHAEGGHIFIQLWFCGRIAHPSLLPNNHDPVAPSAIAAVGDAITYQGPKPFIKPQALTIDEISEIVNQYKYAASRAKQAGFDGIEVHAANGYLIDQFLRDGSNRRDDRYGGTAKNRMIFLNEILDAVCDVWPNNRVGVRLSPENSFNSMSDSNPQTHFNYFSEQLNSRQLAYLHVLEGDMLGAQPQVDYRELRKQYHGCYMANCGYDKAKASRALENKDCDLVAFGVPFLANPDLVHRYQHNLPLNEADQSLFYGGDEHGYTDYPFAEKAS